MIRARPRSRPPRDRSPAGAPRPRPCGAPVLALLLAATAPTFAQAPPTPRPANDGTTADAVSDEEPGTERRGKDPAPDAVARRLERERVDADNPYLFTVHKRNYLLPISHTSNLNDDRYRTLAPELADELGNEEAQFQLSVKVRLNRDDLLVPDDGVFFGFTIESWWQVYSKGISSPFRETNYQPEVFYLAPLEREVLGGRLALGLGFEHQSNGQIQGFSRSWNRLYAAAIWSRGSFVAALRPWYRLPEEEKESPLDPKGDDNPDILDFYGHGELTLGWRDSRRGYALSVHGNPSTGKGGGELAVSFPAFGRFRAVVSYFNGYGDSLIDYDHFQQRLGVGILLSNLF